MKINIYIKVSWDILNVKTSSIIPVDLNSLVCWGAKFLSDYYREMNITVKADEYENIARQWKDAVTAVLWHEDIDYYVSRVLVYLNKEEILKYEGGIPTTLRVTEEQWDQPNAWPPLQFIIVMALDNTGNKEAKMLASKIANKWICTNYVAYKNDSLMYEKYRVDSAGQKGLSTGEYPVQEGFGWSNGIILELLQKYNSTSIKSWEKIAPKCYEVLKNITMSTKNNSKQKQEPVSGTN